MIPSYIWKWQFPLILVKFCQRLFPICCFPGLPDVGAQQGAVAIWSCKFSQISGRIRGKIGNENSWNAKEVLVPKWSNSIVVFIYSKNYLFADKTISRLWYRLKCGNNNSSRFPWVWPVRWVFCLKNCEVFLTESFFRLEFFEKVKKGPSICSDVIRSFYSKIRRVMESVSSWCEKSNMID